MIHVVSSLVGSRGGLVALLLLAQVLTRVDSAYAPSAQFIHQGPRWVNPFKTELAELFS